MIDKNEHVFYEPRQPIQPAKPGTREKCIKEIGDNLARGGYTWLQLKQAWDVYVSISPDSSRNLVDRWRAYGTYCDIRDGLSSNATVSKWKMFPDTFGKPVGLIHQDGYEEI